MKFFISFLSIFLFVQSSWAQPFTGDQFEADRWSDIKSVDAILEAELIFDDFQTSAD